MQELGGRVDCSLSCLGQAVACPAEVRYSIYSHPLAIFVPRTSKMLHLQVIELNCTYVLLTFLFIILVGFQQCFKLHLLPILNAAMKTIHDHIFLEISNSESLYLFFGNVNAFSHDSPSFFSLCLSLCVIACKAVSFISYIVKMRGDVKLDSLISESKNVGWTVRNGLLRTGTKCPVIYGIWNIIPTLLEMVELTSDIFWICGLRQKMLDA